MRIYKNKTDKTKTVNGKIIKPGMELVIEKGKLFIKKSKENLIVKVDEEVIKEIIEDEEVELVEEIVETTEEIIEKPKPKKKPKKTTKKKKSETKD